MTSKIFRNYWRLSGNWLMLRVTGKSAICCRCYGNHVDMTRKAVMIWEKDATQAAATLPALLTGKNFRRSFCMIEATSQETIKFTDENFEQLRKEIQNKGFINHKLFEKLIVTTPRKDISDENALLLITSCAHFLPSATYAEKNSLFRKTWEQLQSEAKLSRDHYLSALDVFRANKFPLAEYKTLLQNAAFELDAEMYEGLIGLACEHGDVDEATDVLMQMKNKQFPITESVFNSLILGYSRQKDIVSSENVLSTMVAANLEPSHKTYTELIKAYVENDLPDKAAKVLVEQKDKLPIDDLVSIIKTAGLKEQKALISQAINTLPVDMVNVLEAPMKIRLICTELVFAGNVDQALMIVSLFPTPKFAENQDNDKFGVSLINDCIMTRQPIDKTIEVCKELIDSGKNPRALHVACSICLRRDPDSGLAYLKALAQVEKLRPHYFWPLILHNASKDGEVGVLNTLKEMVQLGVDVDLDTMSSYVFPRLNVTCKNVKNAIVAFEDAGLQTSQVLTPLISHLLLQQRLKDIAWILQTYQSKIDTDFLLKPLISTATNLRASKNPSQLAQVVALLQSKTTNPKSDISGEILLEILNGKNRAQIEPDLVTDLVREFKAAGVKLSSEAADALAVFLGTNRIPSKKRGAEENIEEMVNKALNLKPTDKLSAHPRDMSLEELECHLIELENKGMNMRGVLRRTLQLSVREKKYERAYEIYKKCLDLKVQKSPGMMASVFEMFVKLGKVEEATATIEELKKTNPGFILDEHKIIDYATLLVRSGKIKDAKEVLKQRAASTKIQGGEYVSKNVWDLLNATAIYAANTNSKSERNETRDMLEYLNSLGYCAFNNVHLGCIIRELLLKKKIFPAVAEYRRIANQYRKTPLQVELMNELVRLSSTPGNEHYNSMLQEVIRETTKIHGVLNTNINVILAIAENGTQNQLRKLLIDPQFKFSEDNLMRNCEHLSSTGKIDVLMKLARASRGLGHMIREEDLYNILLSSFARENNFQAAIELFDKLEGDDDLKISQEFIRNLVDLLKRNNIEIPKNIALKARVMA